MMGKGHHSRFPSWPASSSLPFSLFPLQSCCPFGIAQLGAPAAQAAHSLCHLFWGAALPHHRAIPGLAGLLHNLAVPVPKWRGGRRRRPALCGGRSSSRPAFLLENEHGGGGDRCREAEVRRVHCGEFRAEPGLLPSGPRGGKALEL